MVPVRWMAPELLKKGAGQPSTASDIWSFGITIWEVFSQGNSPYPELANSEVKQHVCDGKTLQPPKNSPEDL